MSMLGWLWSFVVGLVLCVLSVVLVVGLLVVSCWFSFCCVLAVCLVCWLLFGLYCLIVAVCLVLVGCFG